MQRIKQPEIIKPASEGLDQIFLADLRTSSYTVSDNKRVQRLLQIYPFLADFIIEAEKQINAIFIAPKLYLKVKTDPEITGEERLEIAISPSEAQKEAFVKLEQLDDSWWFTVADKVQDKLYITLE